MGLWSLTLFGYDKNHTDTPKTIPKKRQLKTLFLSSILAKSMTAIPALPKYLQYYCMVFQ
jgi:hypothetical protein